jgi:phenylpropionate dioxygenase-like ring-hydroxylating dioxygenase large terminal subunit
MTQIFKRMPLLLATTAELPNPGDYKALEAAGTPVLISRTNNGEIQAFYNMCSHRGAQIMPVGQGNTNQSDRKKYDACITNVVHFRRSRSDDHEATYQF